MRDLDSALTTAQAQTSIKPACKIVFTYGEEELTVEEDRIKDIKEFESLWHYYAKSVVLDNSDSFFGDYDLKGYQAVVYWGAHTASGKKYSYCSPMKVTWQEFDSAPGKLTCLLNLLGIPDLMDLDEANDDYIPASDDSTTVKSLLTAIAGATLDCYDHCQAYTIVWDNDEDDDDLLNFTPADSFRIYVKGSRLAAFRRILEYTNCVARFENDGKIHILIPTTTGTDYDYEYSLSSGHPFLSRAYRQTLVIPNYIVVSSQKDDDPQYSGYATSAASYALLPKRKYYRTRLSSNADGTAIAEALIARAELNAEMGQADALMNCGAELHDYVKVADEKREDTDRTGNIGWLQRHANPERGVYHFEFGFGDPPIVRHTKELYHSLEAETGVAFDRLYAKDAYIEALQVGSIDSVWIDPDGNLDLAECGDTLDGLPDGEIYARVKALHIDAGGIKLDENIIYSEGYDPTDKMSGKATLDDIPDGETYQRILSASLTAEGLVLLDQVQVGTYGLVLATDISAGHIKLSSTEKDGEWYDEAGIEIDANTGINIYGTLNALTTRATKTGTIQCYVGADGAIYAGAGAVKLDASGIKLYGEVLHFYYGATAVGVILGASATQMSIGTLSGKSLVIAGFPIKFGSDADPYADNSQSLGDDSHRYKEIHCVTLHEGDTVFANDWRLTESPDGKGIRLLRPDGSVAMEWR